MGLPYHEFLSMTPRVFYIYANAYRQRLERESEEKVTIAYMNALWSAQWFDKKKPPKLNDLLNKSNKKKVMTPKEMLEKVKQLNAALGGVIKDGN